MARAILLFLNVPVCEDKSNIVLNKLNNASCLEDEIRERLGYQSFQQPDE
jgi:hypothetical protein